MILRPQYYLSFDGVDDYVQARDASVFDVTTGDFDMEVEFRTTDASGNLMRLLDKRGQGGAGSGYPSYQLSSRDNRWGNIILEDINGNSTDGSNNSSFYGISFNNDGDWHTARLTWENSVGAVTLYIGGTQVAQEVNSNMIGNSMTTSRTFTVGAANTGAQYFNGDIKSFRFGTETFPLNEGTGTTITGSEGTVLDIYGATWGVVDEDITDMYVGSTKVQRAYSGSTLMYQTI